jgi:hypothetical protein
MKPQKVLTLIVLVALLSPVLSGCGLFGGDAEDNPIAALFGGSGSSARKPGKPPIEAEVKGVSVILESAAFDKEAAIFVLSVANDTKRAVSFGEEEFFLVVGEDDVTSGTIDDEDGTGIIKPGEEKKLVVTFPAIASGTKTVTLLAGFHWDEENTFDFEFDVDVN